MTEYNDANKNQEILVLFRDDASWGASEDPLTPPPTDEAQTQASWNKKPSEPVKAIRMDAGNIATELSRVSNAIQSALDSTDPPKGKFRVESFEVGLAINASGKIALVAEVGMKASVNVTFTRT